MRFFFVSSLLLAYSAIVSAVADDSCTVETMATFGEWQKGFCVLSNNRDQNSGVKLLEAGDFLDKKFEKDEDKVAHCLHLCACHKEDPVTGCEMIWNQSNRGCYVHTDFIAKGNGVERHSCYLATSPGSWGDNGRVCSASLWGDPHAVTYDGLKVSVSVVIFTRKVSRTTIFSFMIFYFNSSMPNPQVKLSCSKHWGPIPVSKSKPVSKRLEEAGVAILLLQLESQSEANPGQSFKSLSLPTMNLRTNLRLVFLDLHGKRAFA